LQVIAALICRTLLTATLSLFAFHAFAEEAPHIHVVDGDTLDVDGVRYRLHGIDAPEPGQKCKSASGGTWPCGKEASKALTDLVKGGSLICDDRGKEIRGRTLSVCTIDGVDINAEMIRRGMAWSFKKYSHDNDQIEEIAKAKLVGVWQAQTERPGNFERTNGKIGSKKLPMVAQ
jgi:endonuclease YncB( thermonuclease family)